MNLSVSFKFTAQTECCDKCHKTSDDSAEFFFCNLKCFSKWFETVEKRGVPCWDCHTTGFAYGFKVNGKCSLCNGKKYLKESKMVGFADIKGVSHA
jgi:RecJ-like exonuclease